jgi:phage terminase large subunit-like protein
MKTRVRKEMDPGERAVWFLNNLSHTGDYSGEPFALRPWQEGPIRKLFGTLNEDGSRRYRKTFWALPRKQGKTEIVAGGGLFLLMGQRKPNRRIYTASGDTKQAKLIFDAACEMIRNDPDLEDKTVVYRGYKRIEYPEGRSTLEVLSSVPKSKHGLGPTDVLIDEFHVVDEELVNILTTGFGARKSPLTWMITTAGWDRHSLCFDEWQYAVNVRDGVIDDPTYLPVIHAAGGDDDWTDEATWRKAMPALGDFCSVEFIRDEFRKAKERPRFENTFRQLYLNQWTEQATRWIALDAWDACKADFGPEDFEGRECWAGLDLSSKHDLSALVLLFRNDLGGFDVLPFFWLPGESAAERERLDKVPYPVWIRQGYIAHTGGARIDYDEIRDTIFGLAERYEFRLLAFDPPHSGQLANQLYQDGNGLAVQELPNTFLKLNAPSREFERLIAEKKLRHNGHPVLRWCVANASLAEKAEMILPSKAKSTERIDGVAASVMALAAAIADAGPASAAPTVEWI